MELLLGALLSNLRQPLLLLDWALLWRLWDLCCFVFLGTLAVLSPSRHVPPVGAIARGATPHPEVVVSLRRLDPAMGPRGYLYNSVSVLALQYLVAGCGVTVFHLFEGM